MKILLPRFCTPVNLSSLLAVRAVDILKIMIKLGINPIDSNDPLTEGFFSFFFFFFLFFFFIYFFLLFISLFFFSFSFIYIFFFWDLIF